MGISEPRWGYFCGDINDLLKGNLKKQLKNRVSEAKKEGLVGFIGGPPCPDFSIAGKNEGIDGKNGMLTNSYKKIILAQEPDFFVFENVKGLWSTKKHRTEYEKIKESFRKKGYVLVDKLVNSLDYGVPQERERVILFGVRYKLLDNDKKVARDILKREFAFGENNDFSEEKRNECRWPEENEFSENSQLERPNMIIPELSIEYWFRKNDVYKHYNADDYFLPRSLERFKTICEGDVSKKSFKRLHRWRYSPTAAYGNNEVHLHPYKARRMSVAETLAIQSLPKQFSLPSDISLSSKFKTIGNGVPYLAAYGIAKTLKAFLMRI